MPKSSYLASNFVNVALRGVAFTPPPAVYLALFTTMPTAAGGGVEVSTGSYQRVVSTWTAPTQGQSSNAAAISFPVATATWGTVVGFGLYDALVGGNLLYFSPLNAPRTIMPADWIEYPVGQLIVIED